MVYNREFDDDGFVWIESAYQAQSVTLASESTNVEDDIRENVTINEAW